MTTSSNNLIAERRLERPWREIHLPLKLKWTPVALGAIVLLAAVLRLYNIQSVGDANTYYTAAVKSMLQSFSNFFFVAAEPGGAVTIDKPPLGLWLQAISAMILGVNGVAVVLPQIIAGILSVPLLYVLVRRYFGSAAGLIAAFTLAVTPVSIAVERNNTMDATLIFTLLLAAWAYIHATDTGKLRYLLLGGVLVGLGFNIKMMQAFLPLPAFYALYFFGTKLGLRRKIAYLALATVVLLVVSFSWAAVVQLTPASQRPYIGSTQTNNVFELIFSYNGVERLTGQASPGGNGAPPQGATGPQPQPPAGLAGDPPPGAPDGNGTPARATSGRFNTGQAGLLRLVTAPLANEAGWLLPFGLFAVGLLILSSRPRFPLQENHKAAVLWGGWLFTSVIFFSIANFFHPYYLAMLAPPLAALVGVGAIKLWELYRKHHLRFGLLMIAIGVGTVIFQVYTASRYTTNLWWAIPAGVLLVAGSAVLIAGRNVLRFSTIGFVCILVAILWVPTAWSGMTTLYMDASAMLPEAYSGSANSTQMMLTANNAGSATADILAMMENANKAEPALVNYLEAHTQDVEYLVAVPSAMQGASFVLATGRPVLYMGGFNGADPVVDAPKLAQLVADGKVRYVLQDAAGVMPGSPKSNVAAWVIANCKIVTDVSANTAANGDVPGLQAASLYQCGV